jgi:2-polyprenyl-3-methyl-5-hydroxy-6-metoxy-1,4-benzoquinol methylase
MGELLSEVLAKIERLEPMHSKKLAKSISKHDAHFFDEAEVFLAKYSRFLVEIGKDLDFAVASYLRMCADTMYEQIRFLESGEYSSKTFVEVNKRVYSNPAVMEYYMHGLLLSQLLWRHHYATFSFFRQTLPLYKGGIGRYLEVGGGHGLFTSEALRTLDARATVDMVDISASSIEMARRFVASDRVRFTTADVFEYHVAVPYDFITMGEVMEHVENPVSLLRKLGELLSDNGRLFVTVPANAPAIDHIYLFRSADEVREHIARAGFEVDREFTMYAEDVTAARAEKLKVTLMYGAFLRKRQESVS